MTPNAGRALLAQKQYARIVEHAARDKRTLSMLLALTYAADDQIGWRAVKALGLAAHSVAATDAEFVRNILRRLLWSLNAESGSIGWRASQSLGAILAQNPRQFAEFVPLVAALFDLAETHLHAGVLWAIGHIAEQDADGVRFALPHAQTRLTNPDPETRGMAAWCVSRLGDATAIPALRALQTDSAVTHIFADDEWQPTTVGALALNALATLGLKQ